MGWVIRIRKEINLELCYYPRYSFDKDLVIFESKYDIDRHNESQKVKASFKIKSKTIDKLFDSTIYARWAELIWMMTTEKKKLELDSWEFDRKIAYSYCEVYTYKDEPHITVETRFFG